MGCTPGVETPVTPDGPGVLDAGDGWKGLWGRAWRRVCRVCRVVCRRWVYLCNFRAELGIRQAQEQNSEKAPKSGRFAQLRGHWADTIEIQAFIRDAATSWLLNL
jgi:hypothetical protein